MAHPQMFDDADPFLARVRTLAAEFPGSAEKVSHGRPAFYTKKVFAYYGGSRKDDRGWIEHARSLVVRPDPDDRRSLVDEPRVYMPAYLGSSGWVGVDLDEETDWTEITELLHASYRLTAPKRAIDQLDARDGATGVRPPPGGVLTDDGVALLDAGSSPLEPVTNFQRPSVMSQPVDGALR